MKQHWFGPRSGGGREQHEHHHHDHGRRPWGRHGGRRGDGKFAVLQALAEGPKHGYEIMSLLEEQSGYRPSPGSIYPILQMLEDGGYVTAEAQDGKRVYTITDSGRELLAQREPGSEEFDDVPDSRRRLKGAIFKLGMAVQGARGSDDATLEKIRSILDRARRDVYAVLASDEPEGV